MNKYIIITFGVLLHLNSIAQQVMLSGFVENSTMGERLVGATVYLPESKNGVATNKFGYFNLSVNKTETVRLVVGFIGYKNLDTTLQISANKQIILKLSESTLINEVQVNATAKRNAVAETHSVPIKLLTELPSVLAETDVIKSLQFLPGVSGGSESSNGLVVRGGSPDQNLVLLDDVPIYHLNHLGGIVSIFDEHAINDVTLIKGGFSGKYGGRLSSVVDIRSRSGNINKRQTRLSVGTLTTKLSTEGGFANKKGSYMLSGRLSNFNYFVVPISKLAFQGADLLFGFYDLNGKLTYRLNDKNRLSINLYTGNDKVGMASTSKEEEQYGSLNRPLYNIAANTHTAWGNSVIGAKWNRIWSPKLFSNTTLANSTYKHQSLSRMDIDRVADTTKLGWQQSEIMSSVADWLIKSDFEYMLNKKVKMNMGLHNTLHIFTPKQVTVRLNIEENIGTGDNLFAEIESATSSFGDNITYINNSSAYTDIEYSPTPNIEIMIGARLSSYLIERQSYFVPEPRVRFAYSLPNEANIFASYTHMSQPMHLLVGSGVGQPTDRWVPASKTAAPEKAIQYALGLHLGKLPWGLSLETDLYYKQMSNLIHYKAGKNLYSGGNWEDNVETSGIGTAYGFEFMLKRDEGRFTGWLAYTFGNSSRYFENLNTGLAFPYRYDRRHDISLVGSYKINENITLSALWVFATGNHITLGSYKYHALRYDNVYDRAREYAVGFGNNRFRNMPEEYYQSEVHVYPGINNYKLPAYHRFDFNFSFRKTTKRNRLRTWKLGVYNSYNRMNPYMIYYYNRNLTNEVYLEQLTLFPFMPFVNYSLAF